MDIDQFSQELELLIKDDQNDIAHISEDRFVRDLLPVLTDTSENADLTKWLDIAGSWRREIAVHDNNGDVLFIVPALVGSTSINNDPSLPKVDEVIADSARKYSIVPVSGKNHLVKHLTHRINVEGNYVESVRAWNTIFKRYGFTDLIRNIDGVKDTVISEEPVSPDDELDIDGYDEL